MPDRYVDKVEAAAMLGMHPGSLLRAVREGTLPLRPVSRPAPRVAVKYFFAREDVERLARQRRGGFVQTGE